MLEQILFGLLIEQGFLKGKKTKQVFDAIKNRHPITFYYTGPQSPEKDRVLRGVRIRGEAVAMGLSRKGNILVRVYVQPPSVSKKGFTKTGWRTFIINRMSNIQVIEDETFDAKRPGYKEGDESTKGPMAVTYVTTDWTKTPDVKSDRPTTEPPDTPEPEVDDTTQDLPQPKPDEKPLPTPQIQKQDHIGDVFKSIESKIKTVGDEKIISTQDYRDAAIELYRRKEKDWVDAQKEIDGNIKPGEGTRKRFEMSANTELSNLISRNGIKVSDKTDDEVLDIQEQVKRIKTLISYVF